MGGYKVVKVHNGENYEMDRFNEMSNRLRGYSMRMQVSGGLAQPLTQFLASIALAIVITIAVVQSASDQTTVGGFVAFVTSMLLADLAAQASDRHQPAAAARHDGGGTDLRPDRRTRRAARRRPAARARAGRRRVPRRLVQLQLHRDAADARPRVVQGRARRDGRARGPVGQRQDDARQPAAALLRSDAGRGAHRRRAAHRIQPARRCAARSRW